MKVIDLIRSNEKTAFSFEILPPLKGTGIEKLYNTIDTLREFDPKYINITTHRSEFRKRIIRKTQNAQASGDSGGCCCHSKQI